MAKNRALPPSEGPDTSAKPAAKPAPANKSAKPVAKPTPANKSAKPAAKPAPANKSAKPAAKPAPANKSAKPAAKPPPANNKTAKPGQTTTPCAPAPGFNFTESAAKGAAATAVETKAIRAEQRYIQAKRTDFVTAEAARTRSGSAVTWYKNSNSTQAYKILKGAKTGSAVAGAVVETGYQVVKTGGKPNTNAAVEIGSAAACGVATVVVVGTCVAASPVTIPAAAVIGAGILTGAAIDYAATKPKDDIKDVLNVPHADR